MSDYGKILMSTANAVGASLKKKMGSLTGFAPVDWAETINKLGNKLPERTVSGAVCSFSDGADDVPMPSVKASITAVQAGSGDPSPSNVRAISGFAECDVTHLKSRNLLRNTLTSQTSQTVVFTVNSDKSITCNGTASAQVTLYLYGAGATYEDIGLHAGSYKISGGTSDVRFILVRMRNGQTATYTNTGGYTDLVVETGDTFRVFLRVANGTQVSNVTVYPMIRLATESDDTYESYAGETIPVSFGGQTIYGGELNLTTGVLTVTHGIANISTAFRDFSVGTYASVYRMNLSQYASVVSATSAKHGAISNMKVESSAYWGAARGSEANAATAGFAITTDGKVMSIYDADTTLTKETFAEKYANFLAVYPLAETQTIQLTSEEVRSFLGQNNLWANTGDSEVTYFAQPSGGITPVFTEEVICDNSSASSTLTFTEDWHDYDFLQFKLTNSSSGIITYITTTPDLLDEIFARSSSKVLFNEFSNDQYALYTKSSDLSWSRSKTRNVNVTEVKGLTATNCTVSTEWIYKRGAITASNVTITAPKYFEAYDEIYMASCDGDSDDTMPCILPVRAGCAGYNFYGNNGRNCVRLAGNTATDTYGKDETKNIFCMMGINYEEV